jgi:hypothetical protein
VRKVLQEEGGWSRGRGRTRMSSVDQVCALPS